MDSECVRIADQLRRAFAGDSWHGPPLRELLAGITADQARARPLPEGHNIWELVLHIGVWVNAACDAAQGIAMPKIVGSDKDWPPIVDGSSVAWERAIAHLFQIAERCAEQIERCSDTRLTETVPGRSYDFYYLFHGLVQHSLYHGGQIALLKRARTTSK